MPRPDRVRPSVLVLLCVLLALSACASSPSAKPAPASTPSARLAYAALGDSYSAGPLIPVTDVADGCLRSSQNYPSLVAKKLRAKLTDRTCSGADTDDVDRAQYPAVPPQRTALDDKTRLVTVGLGGNDQMVFRSLVDRCPSLGAADPDGSPCRDAFTEGGKDVLAQQLATTAERLTAVLDEVHERAPNAKVLAVGYPQIVDADHVCAELPLARGDFAYAERVNKALTDAVQKAAAATDSTYVDVWTASKDHDICAEDPWINGNVDDKARAAKFHPFAVEQQAVAELVLAASES